MTEASKADVFGRVEFSDGRIEQKATKERKGRDVADAACVGGGAGSVAKGSSAQKTRPGCAKHNRA
jgi:hypothetical protein